MKAIDSEASWASMILIYMKLFGAIFICYFVKKLNKNDSFNKNNI